MSAGETSSDFYAALLVEELARRWPAATFFGCAGPRMRSAGVRNVIDAETLAVVGLVEVFAHLPRIWRQYSKLLAAIRREKPDVAILTDSPDFHLRLARKLARWKIPVVYFVAPQVWAWRGGRLAQMRRTITRLLCIFPFEEQFFRAHKLPATYVGHPLAGRIGPSLTKAEFFRKHALPVDRPLIAVLPGSRRGEAARHLPELLSAMEILKREHSPAFVLPASPNTGVAFFQERIRGASVHVIEGEAWDAMAHGDLALAASGTVTTEAALLGTPVVTFYRVNGLTWLIGKLLVKVPFFTMINLIAGRRVVPELIQSDMNGRRIAEEAGQLLKDETRRMEMKRGLAEVAAKLSLRGNAIARAADEIVNLMEVEVVGNA